MSGSGIPAGAGGGLSCASAGAAPRARTTASATATRRRDVTSLPLQVQLAAADEAGDRVALHVELAGAAVPAGELEAHRVAVDGADQGPAEIGTPADVDVAGH